MTRRAKKPKSKKRPNDETKRHETKTCAPEAKIEDQDATFDGGGGVVNKRGQQLIIQDSKKK